MNPRILYAINSFNDLCPGNAFRELLDQMLRQNYEISVAVLDLRQPKREAAFTLPDIPFQYIGKRFVWDVGAVIQLRKWAAQNNAELVHAWTGRANRIARFASTMAKWHLLTTKLDLKSETNLNHLTTARMNAISSQIVVSHEEIAARLEQLGIEEQKIRRIRIGAPLPKFTDVSDKENGSSELRETFHLPQDIFLIGANAELVPENRFKDLLWATDLVQCVRSDFRVLIFGSGPQKWRLEKFAQQCHAADKTIFVGSDTDFLRWLPEFDLYWHAYTYDPVPFNVIAALRSGCAVLAPRAAGIDSIIEDGVNGILFDVGQRDQIARKTNALFQDPKQLATLKRNAAETPTAFDISMSVEDLNEIYRSLI